MRFTSFAAAVLAAFWLAFPAAAATTYTGDTSSQGFTLPGVDEPGRYRVSFSIIGPQLVDVSWTIEESFERFELSSGALFDVGMQDRLFQQSFGSDGVFDIIVSAPTEQADSAGAVELVRRSAWSLRSIGFHFPEPSENPAFYEVTVARVGSIPEPGTWAVMILGFGLAGAAVRRRGRPALA